MFKWTIWGRQRKCFHHDHVDGITWIRSSLIDLGRRKMFWCTACGREWYV